MPVAPQFVLVTLTPSKKTLNWLVIEKLPILKNKNRTLTPEWPDKPLKLFLTQPLLGVSAAYPPIMVYIPQVLEVDELYVHELSIVNVEKNSELRAVVTVEVLQDPELSVYPE